ncbi:MAG: hypothetical protein HC880_07250 [Bacteroidia bacterium]|nr:hypothetical protein [Bacteroidia bacterium]
MPDNYLTFSHNLTMLNQYLQYFSSSAAGASSVRRYLLDMTTDCSNIFGHWHPSKRYNDEAGWDNRTISDCFQEEQEKCYDKVLEMFVDGFIQ